MADTFVSLIERGASADDIAAHLDGLDQAERVTQVRACPGRLQKKLWGMVEGRNVALLDFVAPPDETVVYAGKNSLPLFSSFEKRFWRPGDGGETVGYNHQSMSAVTGPGYFFSRDSENGELEFDYTRTPELQPPGWPPIKSNQGLISSLVYGGMTDYNRRVSQHTVLGRASKRGKEMNAYYLLTLSSA